jgi:site-specific recombinase XerD
MVAAMASTVTRDNTGVDLGIARKRCPLSSCYGPPGNEKPALFLNQRGGSLSVKAAHDIITGIASRAGLDDEITAHVLRHTFATTLVRGGTDLVIVAELLGHARLETTRGYARPTTEDRIRALVLLPTDE